LLPVLVILDLMGSHAWDVPTVDPSYWTVPPPSAERLRGEPTVQRVLGQSRYSAAEPGFASEPIDLYAARETLAWSLPPVWGLSSSIGLTPIIPRRLLTYSDNAKPGRGRFDIEGVSYAVTADPDRLVGFDRPVKAGSAFLHRNPTVQLRARLMGRPVYVRGELEAAAAIRRLGTLMRDRLIVEDPDHPLPEDAAVSGRAEITSEIPERVEVATESTSPAYLVLADTYDPGWSATIDGQPTPIRPAFSAFRAVYVPRGPHRVTFSYRPMGFKRGLIATAIGTVIALALLAWPRRVATLGPAHEPLGWPRRWPWVELALLVAIVAGSSVDLGPGGRPRFQRRWSGSWHQFTWGTEPDPTRLRPRWAPLPDLPTPARRVLLFEGRSPKLGIF
jgi:hypothetical protein